MVPCCADICIAREEVSVARFGSRRSRRWSSRGKALLNVHGQHVNLRDAMSPCCQQR